jgi:hypothetical protein
VDGNANQQESKGLQPKQMKNKTDFIKYINAALQHALS